MLGGDGKLNMTWLALNLNGYVNGIAKSHAEVSYKMFPGYSLLAIGNGEQRIAWACPCVMGLYTRHIPARSHEPG